MGTVLSRGTSNSGPNVAGASVVDAARSNRLSEDTAARLMMEPIASLLKRHPLATELAINRPGQALIEVDGHWIEIEAPELSEQHCMGLARAVAIFCKQEISERCPLLSATLPDGQRLQVVMPPAVESGHIAICMRIPGSSVRSIDSYRAAGAFDRFVLNKGGVRQELKPIDRQLMGLLEDRKLLEFLILAIKCKKNIAIVGDTGSGKTTLMKSICQWIPLRERIITIEDVRELELPHINKLHLLYTKGDQGVAKITPAELISACMRLKPTRTLMAELRGSEAFDFLKMMTAGHAGAITSFHAPSCEVALQRYVFMAKEHPDAAIFTDKALKDLINQTIDVFMHVTADLSYDEAGTITGLERYVTEVRFDPLKTSTGGAA
jgi:type IV secretion system protein VirB11